MLSQVIVAVGFTTAKEGYFDLLGADLKEFINKNKKEPGCLQSLIYIDAKNSHKFFLYEVWESQAHWTKHLQQAHVQNLVGIIQSKTTEIELHKFIPYDI